MRVVASVGLFVCLAVANVSAQPASAQPAPDAPPAADAPEPAPAAAAPAGAPVPVQVVEPAPRVRHGLFGGGGLFGGNISCDGADCGGFREAGGLSGHIGWLFNPKLGVLLDVWAMTSSKNDVSVTFVTSTVNVRYYLAPTFWVQGGLGNGHAIVRVAIFAGRSDDVPVGQLAAGLELVRGKSWALDVAFKVAQGSSTDRGSAAADDAQTGRSVGLGAHVTLF